MKTSTIFTCAATLLVCLSGSAQAQLISDRTALDDILGSQAITDTFAGVPVLPGVQLRIYSAVEATTVAPINCRSLPLHERGRRHGRSGIGDARSHLRSTEWTRNHLSN